MEFIMKRQTVSKFQNFWLWKYTLERYKIVADSVNSIETSDKSIKNDLC